MDDRIQELLERARETAATAGEYAGQMVDTARLRGRLFALRTDINVAWVCTRRGDCKFRV